MASNQFEIFSALNEILDELYIIYLKDMDLSEICFIPGKILDKMLQIIRKTGNDTNYSRRIEELEEVYDISKVAVLHFRKHILFNIDVSNFVFET